MKEPHDKQFEGVEVEPNEDLKDSPQFLKSTELTENDLIMNTKLKKYDVSSSLIIEVFRKYVLPMTAILLTHILFGLHPVFSRYLQYKAKLPSLSLVSCLYGIGLILYLPKALYDLWILIRKYKSDFFKMQVVPLLKNWILWVFVIDVALRSVTNILASRFTSATFVQLITLSTPFMVSFLSCIFLRERVSIATIICMVVTIIGGILLILAGSNPSKSGNYEFHWTIDFSKIGQNLTWDDLIGIATAATSSFLLAVYMVLVRYSGKAKPELSLSRNTLFFWQLLSCSFIFLPVSFAIQEDWSKYGELDAVGWIVFFAFGIFVFFLANLTNIYAISTMGAPKTSSILALRLVSTLLFSYILLGELLNNFWQIFGAVLVIIAISAYMIYNVFEARKKMKKKESQNTSINK
jgi:drug/metabolite transporter (DMT)-like permease